MSSNDAVRTALVEMGVDPDKAHEAALRYHNTEAAINWVFGEGESWTPGAPDPSPQYSQQHQDAWTSEVQSGVQLGSNNPFRPPSPALPAPMRTMWHDDAQTHMAVNEMYSDTPAERAERERSVRAAAPPPSPSRSGLQDEEAVAFGPSNKSDPEGKLAVAVAPSSTQAQADNNKEEEDFQRAIQESMMTASFHSAGSPKPAYIPPQEPKEHGAPTVFLAVEQPMFGAHLLQAIMAVPQLANVLTTLQPDQDDSLALITLEEACRAQLQDTNNYLLADDYIQVLHKEWNINSTTLPPHGAITDRWIPNLFNVMSDASESMNNNLLFEDELHDFFHNPGQLFTTLLYSVPMVPHHFVTFDRTMSTSNRIQDALAGLIWPPDNSGESIQQLADIVFVCLRRIPGVSAPKWEFDESVYLDRYLTANAPWAANIRAEQAVLKGELRRCKESVERLTTYKEQNLPDAIKTLIKHLGAEPPTSDEPYTARADLKAKLEHISEIIKTKVAELEAKIAENETRLEGTLFDTDDPSKRQHQYMLRAILWHDGFMTPGKHLYAYVRNDEGWWHIGDEAKRVSWDEIEADSKGQFTDGGPYFLVYSRDGPRPDPNTVSDLVDVEMTEAAPSGTAPGADTAPSRSNSMTDVPPDLSVSTSSSATVTTSRSRPPSPVKGLVKGPRPLVKKTSGGDASEGAVTPTSPFITTSVAATGTLVESPTQPTTTTSLPPAPPEGQLVDVNPNAPSNETKDVDDDTVMDHS